MKIGFDAKRAFQNFTGLGNYSRFVIKALAQHQSQNQYFLYAPKAIKNPRTSFLFQLQNVIIKTAPIKWLKSYWRSKGVIKDLVADQVELYHGLSHEIPAGLQQKGIKSVVTIHDLIYLRYPKFFKYIDRKIYDYKFRAACKNADQIIAISEQTKRDIIKYFSTNANKITVVYQSCDEVFYQSASADFKKDIIEKYHLPKQYLLCVGTVEERKNQLLILKALKLLPENISLVLVGKKTDYVKQLGLFIADNKLENRVQFLTDVPFSDLPAIYQLAKIFVYPSRFEGFGIPILEALNSEIPVVAAKGSCLEEAGGPYSIYISPNDEQELATAILKVWNDENLAQQMVMKGKEYALNFKAEKIANDLMEVYQKTKFANV
jgi:glycosyltransferase involved in cell wall biosynthesis